MKTSKISIFKDHCKHIAGLCSSTIIIATKPAHDKLLLSTISYPYQQLVTLSSTISYPLLASHSTGYTYPQLATLFNFKSLILKISKKIASQRYCNHIVGLFSSIKVVVTKGKLPLSTFGYPYQQLVTILTKKTEAGIFKTFIAIAFKKISYPLSTISYPYQQLVTPHPHLVTLHPHLVTLHPHLVTLFSIHNRNFKVLANKKYCYTTRVLSNNLINKIYASYTSSTFSYTCYSKTPTTMGKTYFLLKLLQNLFKNLVNIQEYHYGY